MEIKDLDPELYEWIKEDLIKTTGSFNPKMFKSYTDSSGSDFIYVFPDGRWFPYKVTTI